MSWNEVAITGIRRLDKATSTNHDALFKDLIRTFFKEFVELFLPNECLYIDFTHQVSFLEQEILPDLCSSDKHVVDLLAEVKLRSYAALVLIHIEAQAQYQEAFAERMFTYFCRLWVKHRRPIYPVAIFSYDSPHDEPSEYAVELPWGTTAWVKFHTIELRKLHWRDYLQHDNPVAAALLSKMGYDEAERVTLKLEFLRMLVRLQLDPARSGLLLGFFDSYIKLSAEEERQLVSETRSKLNPNEANMVREYTNSYIEMGREEGMEAGLAT